MLRIPLGQQDTDLMVRVSHKLGIIAERSPDEDMALQYAIGLLIFFLTHEQICLDDEYHVLRLDPALLRGETGGSYNLRLSPEGLKAWQMLKFLLGQRLGEVVDDTGLLRQALILLDFYLDRVRGGHTLYYSTRRGLKEFCLAIV